MTDWKPTSSDEQSLYDAVCSLQSSISPVLKGTEPPTLILTCKGVFDFIAFVTSLKALPRKGDDFEQQFYQTLQPLFAADKAAYEGIERTFVDIGRACDEYYANDLSRLVTTSSSLIRYADVVARFLTKDNFMCLKQQFGAALAGDEDAKEMARMVLQSVTQEATSTRGEVNAVVEKLITFRKTVMAIQSNVEASAKQLKSQGIAEYTKLYETIEMIGGHLPQTWVEPIFSFLPGIGSVVMDKSAVQAHKSDYEALVEAYHAAKKDDSQKVLLITLATTMTYQYSGIDAKMGAAIAAMTEVSRMLNSHVTCCDQLTSYLARNKYDGKAKAFVEAKLDSTVEMLDKLKSAAKDCIQSINREYRF